MRSDARSRSAVPFDAVFPFFSVAVIPHNRPETLAKQHSPPSPRPSGIINLETLEDHCFLHLASCIITQFTFEREHLFLRLNTPPRREHTPFPYFNLVADRLTSGPECFSRQLLLLQSRCLDIEFFCVLSPVCQRWTMCNCHSTKGISMLRTIRQDWTAVPVQTTFPSLSYRPSSFR